MADDTAVPLSSPLSRSNDYTNQIHEIFTEHWNTLEGRWKKQIEEIDEWERNLKENIQMRADKQKNRINKHYKRLRPTLDEKYRVHLELAVKHHDAQQEKLFKELLKTCQSLTLQVAKFESAVQQIDAIEIVIQDELLTVNSFVQSEARQRRRTRHKKDVTKNPVTTNDESLPNSPTSDQKRTAGQQTKTSPTRTRTDESDNQMKNASGSDSKCPICFMIFPRSMTRDGRDEHVNEHSFGD